MPTPTSKLKLVRLLVAAAALGTLVAAEVLDWGLSEMVAGTLGSVAGWLLLRRPGEE